MKLKLFLWMFFVVAIATFNCDELKPKEWKTTDLLLFVNPFATFEPSFFSKGHVKAFDDIDKMSYEQKINLKEFTNELELLKIFGTLVPSALLSIAAYKYKLLKEMRPIFQVAGTLFFISMWYVSSEYVMRLHAFKNRIDQSLSDEKK